jgi:pyrimidine-nucleoside phosphorylase
MTTALHAVDIIRRKRDGHPLDPAQIRFMARAAASGSIPDDQLAAWLMACFLRGLDANELAELTIAMRDSGEKRSRGSGFAVDKHSTGGVGDKTSFLVAPIAAAAGLMVPMISGRALGHTGGTLDKLESIPGYNTQLSLAQMDDVLTRVGVSIVGQTRNLVPADRVLYALRDRTGTVESPQLICASIMSKKLAAGLDGLVLDVKTGSGAFLKGEEQARLLASLMVQTGERADTRTVALITNMDQPLGRFAGNWVEIWESVSLMRGERHPLSEDLRELSLVLAGWMIHLGGKAGDSNEGRGLAEKLLISGAALARFEKMVEAQGGDASCLAKPEQFHQPKVREQVVAERSGFITSVDCEAVGWAVQRLGAGREQAGEHVSAMAGIELHAKLGDRVEAGQTIYTMFADEASRLDEPAVLLRRATVIGDEKIQVRPLVMDTISAASL